MNLVKSVALLAGGAALAVGAMGFMVWRATRPEESIQEGDMVQWESGGKYMFAAPQKITKIVDSVWGRYVYVSDSATAIPAYQVVKVQ
jgi:hypothetical protein